MALWNLLASQIVRIIWGLGRGVVLLVLVTRFYLVMPFQTLCVVALQCAVTQSVQEGIPK